MSETKIGGGSKIAQGVSSNLIQAELKNVLSQHDWFAQFIWEFGKITGVRIFINAINDGDLKGITSIPYFDVAITSAIYVTFKDMIKIRSQYIPKWFEPFLDALTAIGVKSFGTAGVRIILNTFAIWDKKDVSVFPLIAENISVELISYAYEFVKTNVYIPPNQVNQ